MLSIFADISAAEVASTIAYTVLAAALMGLIWVVIDRLTPFCVRKEIEEDQNVALAILVAGIFVSMSIVMAAVLLS